MADEWVLGANSKRLDVRDWVECAPRCVSCSKPLAVTYSGLRSEDAWVMCSSSPQECKYGHERHTFIKMP